MGYQRLERRRSRAQVCKNKTAYTRSIICHTSVTSKDFYMSDMMGKDFTKEWALAYIEHLIRERDYYREYIERNMPPHHQIVLSCGLGSEGFKRRVEVIPIVYGSGDNGGILDPRKKTNHDK